MHSANAKSNAWSYGEGEVLAASSGVGVWFAPRSVGSPELSSNLVRTTQLQIINIVT